MACVVCPLDGLVKKPKIYVINQIAKMNSKLFLFIFGLVFGNSFMLPTSPVRVYGLFQAVTLYLGKKSDENEENGSGIQ